MAEPISLEFIARPCSHPEIDPAERYTYCDDLLLLTCYFNSNNFQSRRANYDAFAHPIHESGLQLLTIECVFGDNEFTLPPSPNILRVRTPHVM